MTTRTIIFVPGKNPKPQPEQHRQLLWRTLLEGVGRAAPETAAEIAAVADDFHLVAWNHLYYQEYKDIARDLPWIDALLHQHGPTPQDLAEAQSWHIRRERFFYNVADLFPFVIRLLPEPIRRNAEELNRYFINAGNVACEIRELLKSLLRPRLQNSERVLLIGHSMGSAIAYDALWELTHEERLPGKVDCFLTLGSPLGMRYVQHRIQGHQYNDARRYPHNIRRWVNLSSVGDVVALDRNFRDDFRMMLELGLVEAIEDHCGGIYNFFRNDQGLNCHRSYGYMVNPAVGTLIAQWWQAQP